MQTVEAFRALHKCWYPSCVGQAAAAWILSPFGSNLLLSVLKGREEKYAKVYKELQRNERCKIRTSLFLTPRLQDADKFKSLLYNDIKINIVDFTRGDDLSIGYWITSHHPVFNEFKIKIPTDTNFVLANVCLFESPWTATSSEGRLMKIHNSFNYTQDVNYEARILELPMRDEEFRVIVLVPNQEDLLNTLFRRLSNEGLAASFASVQPLFSVNTVLTPPIFNILSETDVSLEEEGKGQFPHETLVQYGAISIDSKIVRAYVLSCLCSTESRATRDPVESLKKKEEKPYFFAITFDDLPIFSGQYIPSLI